MEKDTKKAHCFQWAILFSGFFEAGSPLFAVSFLPFSLYDAVTCLGFPACLVAGRCNLFRPFDMQFIRLFSGFLGVHCAGYASPYQTSFAYLVCSLENPFTVGKRITGRRKRKRALRQGADSLRDSLPDCKPDHLAILRQALSFGFSRYVVWVC